MLEQEYYLPLTKLSSKQVWSVYQVINTRGGRDDAEHEATFGKSEKNLARIGK